MAEDTPLDRARAVLPELSWASIVTRAAMLGERPSDFIRRACERELKACAERDVRLLMERYPPAGKRQPVRKVDQ